MRVKARPYPTQAAPVEASVGIMAQETATTFQSTLPAQLLLPRPVHLRAAVLFAPPL